MTRPARLGGDGRMTAMLETVGTPTTVHDGVETWTVTAEHHIAPRTGWFWTATLVNASYWCATLTFATEAAARASAERWIRGEAS